MSERKKKITRGLLMLIPFIIGTVGLLLDKRGILDSMFKSFQMYFLNYEESAPNALVEIARWLAPALLISEVLTFLREIWTGLKNKKAILSNDAVAVYCSEDDKDKYLGLIENSVYAGKQIRKDARHHIVMLENDHESLELADRIENGDVYVQLLETDSFLLKATDRHFFNVNEIIARTFWKENDLTGENVSDLNIAIVGYGNLGKMLLKYGIMYNVYSLEQSISYHVFTASAQEQSFPEIPGNDRILFHTENDRAIFDCDMVIFTEKAEVSMVESLLYSFKCRRIFYCSDKPYLKNVYGDERIICYGSNAVSGENIMTARLYREAIELNFSYKCRYEGCSPDTPAEEKERYFNELSGFLKGSNITACDYHEIRRKILDRDGNPEIEKDDKYVQMEHIRWCRYYYVNHWTYGLPEDKAERDALRIHSCLVPYDSLSRTDKDKDFDTIKEVTALFG